MQSYKRLIHIICIRDCPLIYFCLYSTEQLYTFTSHLFLRFVLQVASKTQVWSKRTFFVAEAFNYEPKIRQRWCYDGTDRELEQTICTEFTKISQGKVRDIAPKDGKTSCPSTNDVQLPAHIYSWCFIPWILEGVQTEKSVLKHALSSSA